MTVAKMFRPVGQRQRRQDHRHCTCGAADHPWTAAEDARDKPDREGRVKPRQRAETCNQREGHRFRNQGHGHREATENFEAVIDRLAEVKEAKRMR